MFSKSGDRGKSSASSNLFSRLNARKNALNILNRSNRKAQVTVYIILGIILLIAVALIILLQQELIKLPGQDLILIQKGAVETYVTDCITNVGEEALLLAGKQGGYVKVPERYTDDITWSIQLSPFMYVPLWANGAEIDQPSLDEIKIQVDDYIEENVPSCLFDPEVFQETYDIVEISDIEADTEFLSGKTQFNVHWNLLVKDKEGELVAELIDHTAESRIRFKSLYEMADAVLDSEMDTLKLEDITQDLIALEHEDVPVAGMEISCNEKKWRVDTAENTLKDMLRINLRNLKIDGTDYQDFPDDLPYYQNHYVWDIEHYDEDISGVFKFENTYPFTFQVTPREGNYMTSDRLGGGTMLSFLCIQNWKFTYDVIYPVIIELRDEQSGGVFQMAFTVNLIGNYPYKGPAIARESQNIPSVTDEDYCYNSPSYVPMSIETYSLVSNEATGVYYREPLDGVNISYTCIRYKCEMGQTEYDFEERGDVAGLSDQFPYCAAAIMRGNKESYLETWQYVVSSDDLVVELEMRPLVEFSMADVEVVKHQVEERDCTDEEIEMQGEDVLCFDISDGKALDDDETALVTIKYFPGSAPVAPVETATNETIGNETGTDLETGSASSDVLELGEFLQGGAELHKVELVYSPTLDTEILEETKVQLLSGADFEYDVLIYLVNEEDLIGGYRGQWLLPWTSLQEGSMIQFHVLEVSPSNEDYYYEFLSNMDDYSQELPVPELI
ncbi:MAG: hypothetical protein KJ896_04210 [Nanoarchaeota archaeon]|nr:hypothetical protein [Nanoarchaeota archaeon]